MYSPIIIPTLNRFTHFKNCVESLAACTNADKTELIIGLDYPPSEKYVDGWIKIKDGKWTTYKVNGCYVGVQFTKDNN